MNEHQIRIECLTLALRYVSPPNAPIEAITEFADQLYKFITKESPSLPVIS